MKGNEAFGFCCPFLHFPISLTVQRILIFSLLCWSRNVHCRTQRMLRASLIFTLLLHSKPYFWYTSTKASRTHFQWWRIHTQRPSSSYSPPLFFPTPLFFRRDFIYMQRGRASLRALAGGNSGSAGNNRVEVPQFYRLNFYLH